MDRVYPVCHQPGRNYPAVFHYESVKVQYKKDNCLLYQLLCGSDFGGMYLVYGGLGELRKNVGVCYVFGICGIFALS